MMARNLYRFYLYAVFIALLIFATVGLGRLLQTLLALTALRGAYSTPPTRADIVQVAVFFAVSWIVAAVLAGLHYWLIQRDMQSDSSAGGNAIRSFFLNIVEFIAVPLAVGVSSFVIQSLGQMYSGDVTVPAAISIATLVLVAVLEWERQRTQAGPGAAITFQRLHLYGVQLILLLLLTSSWLSTVKLLTDNLLFGGQGSLSVGGPSPCGGFTVCQGPNLLSFVAGTFWIVLFWVGYGFLARNDTSSILRQIVHYGSVAYGVGFVLYGIERGIELLLRRLLGVPTALSDVVGLSASYDFVSPITLGLIVIGVYSTWLRMASRRESEGWVRALLTGEAITTALLAAVFWWGIGFVLLNALESVSGARVEPGDWAGAIALVITGIGYIPFDLYLQRRSSQDAAIASVPRRGFVFALLGSGIIVGAVGAAVALYALGTFLLGSPLNDWPHVARLGLSAFVVGAAIVGIYLWRATHEHLFSGLAKGTTSIKVITTTPAIAIAPVLGAEATVRPFTIEEVLDDLLAGKITREEAAAQIRTMTSPQQSKV